MGGVQVIALLAGIVTSATVFSLVHRRQLHLGYAGIWLICGLLILFFGAFPSVFNGLAHNLGVSSPPALLTTLASLFLLVMVVRFSWEIGRQEDRARRLAEDLALLRKDIEDFRKGRDPGL